MKMSIRLCVLFSSFLLLTSAFPQGSLTPPGSPAPTMKSLDQVEARTPIDATNTPGDTDSEAVISAAGSYYLTGNLHVAKSTGIHVTATGVTIDLNGFQIDRASGTPNMAIRLESSTQNCAIKNGSINGSFSIGIGGVGNNGSCSGVVISGCVNTGLNTGTNWRVRSCSFHDNGRGMLVNPSSIVTDCTAYNNNGFGIVTTDHVTLIGCDASANTAGGISTGGNGSTLTNCTASYNLGNGISASDGTALANCEANNNNPYGISVGKGCSLTNCTAAFNTSSLVGSGGIGTGNNCSLTNCTASNNTTTAGTHTVTTGTGFVLGSNCTMQGCTASNNDGDGVAFAGSCLITGNNSSNNGFNGFHVTGAGLSALNRIDGNIANHNTGAGILWSNDYVVRNVSFANTTAYSPAVGGNNTGPVQAAGSATNAFANF